MDQLDAGHRALRGQEFGDPAETLRLHVVPQTEVVDTASASRVDGGGFGHDQCGTTDGAGAEVLDMPVGR